MLNRFSRQLKSQYLFLLVLLVTGFVLDAVNATDFIPNSVCYHGEPGVDFGNADNNQFDTYLSANANVCAPQTKQYISPKAKANSDGSLARTFYDQDSPSLQVEYASDTFSTVLCKSPEITVLSQNVYSLELYLKNRSLLI